MNQGLENTLNSKGNLNYFGMNRERSRNFYNQNNIKNNENGNEMGNNKTKLSSLAENNIFNQKNSFGKSIKLNGIGYFPPILGPAERNNYNINNNKRGMSDNKGFYNRQAYGRSGNFSDDDYLFK